MVEFRDRRELIGLGTLGFGFVLFTFGTLRNVTAGPEPWAVAMGVVGALLGFAAAAYLVVHYHIVAIIGE